MYLNLFRLKELPFRLSPDPGYLFLSPPHARAKAAMQAALAAEGGGAVITGLLGAGKTTLLESVRRTLGPEVALARLSQPQLAPQGFLQGLLVQFGFAPFQMSDDELRATVDRFLGEQHAAGRRVLVIIDDAQTLAAAVLVELGRLTGHGAGQPLGVILAGEPGLAETLALPEHALLAGRLHETVYLAPLPDGDTASYVQHRLDVAGAGGRRIFTDAAIAVVRRYTGGVPRLVNRLCDTAMMSAYALHKDTVDAAEVRAAVQELKWSEYVAPESRPPPTVLVPRGPAPESARPLVGRLRVTIEGREVAAIELRPGKLMIGRTSENDLQLDSKYISRRHCQLTVTPEGVTVEDLNSTNGTVVAGQRVRRHGLKDGDQVMIGLHTLCYTAERADGSAATR